MSYYISKGDIQNFRNYLTQEEKSKGTIGKYLHDVAVFTGWLAGRELSREYVAGWKESLILANYAPVTINSMLSAVNCLLKFLGYSEYRVKFLKIQRKVFCDQRRELGRDEYGRLLDTARSRGKERLALLMETICSTGIRVSEVQYITVEAVIKGRTDISLKGKIRTILLTERLCKRLLLFARKQKITTGEIFVTSRKKGMSRHQIWRDMKALCRHAGVEESKVFPHNLRHLFAVVYYHANGDIVKLADLLGHTSIETTRIYLISTGAEHRKQLERLGLVS